MNCKKFWFGLLSIGIPLTLLAAQIRWYNDAGIPQKTAMDGTEIFSMQQTGPNAYRWAYLNDIMRAFGVTNYTSVSTQYVVYGSNYYEGDTYVSNYFATNVFNNTISSNYFWDFIYYTNLYQTNITIEQYMTFNDYVSNYVTTNIWNDTYVSNYFETNLFPTTILAVTNTIGGAYIFNLNGIGTNLTVRDGLSLQGDGTTPGGFDLYNAAGTLIMAGFNGTYFFGNGWGLTNLNIQTTNIITTNLYVDNSVHVRSNLYVTNLYYLTAQAADVPWVGPSNQIDFTRGSLQSYATWVPISITNVTGATNGYGNTCLLCITNKSGSNISYTLTATGWHLGRGDPTSVTNGGIIELWFQEATGRKTLAVKEFIP